jgi:hypothetical protein
VTGCDDVLLDLAAVRAHPAPLLRGDLLDVDQDGS